MFRRSVWPIGAIVCVMMLGLPAIAAAQEGPGISQEMFTINNLWIMMAGCMVFIMHLGFATLESGLTRSKNNVNILFKNTMIVCIGILMYALVGFHMMYPGDNHWLIHGVFGLGWGITASLDNASKFTALYGDGGYTWYTDFFFQAMFAATAATIVSGAVAERVKLAPFLIFTVLFVGISYNITGSWKWGGGWLDQLGFYDFAGSTLVHSVGGWVRCSGHGCSGHAWGNMAKHG